MFLDDRFRPITDTVGVLAWPAAPLAADYAAWMSGNLGGEASLAIKWLSPSSMGEHLTCLCPLVKVGMTRVLFQPVSPTWTACFTNGWRGTDMSSIVPMLSDRLGCTGVRVTCVPDLGKGPSRRYGARILEYHDGSRPPSRVISVANDGGKWVQHLAGSPLPGERAEWMDALRVRDRFSADQLRTLVGQLVPELWGLGEAVSDALMVERVGPIPATATPLELRDVQTSIPTASPL